MDKKDYWWQTGEIKPTPHADATWESILGSQTENAEPEEKESKVDRREIVALWIGFAMSVLLLCVPPTSRSSGSFNGFRLISDAIGYRIHFGLLLFTEFLIVAGVALTVLTIRRAK